MSKRGETSPPKTVAEFMPAMLELFGEIHETLRGIEIELKKHNKTAAQQAEHLDSIRDAIIDIEFGVDTNSIVDAIKELGDALAGQKKRRRVERE